MSKTEFIDYNELSKIDLYDLLTLTQTACNEDIRRAFKKIAINYHPDKNKNQTDKNLVGANMSQIIVISFLGLNILKDYF